MCIDNFLSFWLYSPTLQKNLSLGTEESPPNESQNTAPSRREIDMLLSSIIFAIIVDDLFLEIMTPLGKLNCDGGRIKSLE